MAPGPLHPVMILEQSEVPPTPSPAATQPRALWLTFFDLVFWDFPPVQRLFFYDNADVLVSEFLLRELPLFKKSLAATLHYFYPLAGKLTCDISEVVTPEVVFSDGDAVRLTVAASCDDFRDLAGDHARDVGRFRALLPPLPKHGGSRGVLAIQLTVFPGAGVCIGTTLHHAVADGASYAHFMKTWAAIHLLCKKPVDALPLFDRSVVPDRAGLRQVFLRDHRALAGDKRLEAWDLSRRSDIVFATFRFTDKLLHELGRHVESETSAQCSPYALACGAAWAGIVHARGGCEPTYAHFGFVTGCKPRTNPPIPANYLGNCLGLCPVEAKRSGLTVATAAAAIWRVIEGLAEEGQVFKDAAKWVRHVRDYASVRAVTVAGSPKLGMYATDFGAPWGRPRKVEIVSVERTGALALAESGRDGDGGIELGLALSRKEMEVFRAFYSKLLSSI